ncbi:MAG: hypothetical protein JXR76_12210 [Deltaproteobacteria bacterium]|nr:hypothetical protein [Deltaproteobacteria bacterium]
MNRYICISLMLGLAILSTLSGCSFGDNLDDLKAKWNESIKTDSGTDTATTTSTDTDSATTTDTVFWGSDSDSSSVDVNSTDSDSNSDSSTEPTSTDDTATGEDCDAKGWQCGQGINSLNFQLDCDQEAGCASSGEWCDTDHQCQLCNTPEHCGSKCVTCGVGDYEQTPLCFEDTDTTNTQCVACLTDSDCVTAAASYCDTESHTCHECVVHEHCRPEIEVVVVAHVDTAVDTGTGVDTTTTADTSSATASDSDSATDTSTDSDTGADTDSIIDTGTIIEIIDTETDTQYRADTERPWLSPIGVCTPDKTCTCWVPSPTVEDTDERAVLVEDCEDDSDCPAGFECLLDFSNGATAHSACLRLCDFSAETTMMNGLACILKDKYFAWAPATTCFALSRLGRDCVNEVGAPNFDFCRIDTKFKDGDCVHDDDTNIWECTYKCLNNLSIGDNDWCPSGFFCGIPPDYLNICIENQP